MCVCHVNVIILFAGMLDNFLFVHYKHHETKTTFSLTVDIHIFHSTDFFSLKIIGQRHKCDLFIYNFYHFNS